VAAGLSERLNSDLKQAMKGGDKVRRSVIRLVLAAVQNAEIARKAALEDSDIFGKPAVEDFDNSMNYSRYFWIDQELKNAMRY